jgi:hypothetical protein
MRHHFTAFRRAPFGLQFFCLEDDVAFGRWHPPDQQVAVRIQHGFRQKAAVRHAFGQGAGQLIGGAWRHRLTGEDDWLAIHVFDIMDSCQCAVVVALVDQHGLRQS